MKTLKDKIEKYDVPTFPDGSLNCKGIFFYEDVEKVVLKFEENIKKYSEKRDGLITIGRGEVLRLINETFGDFRE